MSNERSGAFWLLHEMAPTKLIATVVSVTRQDGVGSVVLGFGEEDPRVILGARTELWVSGDVALDLAALLQVNAAQNMWLRSGPVVFGQGVGSASVSVVGENRPRSPVCITWSTTDDTIVWRADPDGHQWWLREDRALELSFAIITELARFSTSVHKHRSAEP